MPKKRQEEPPNHERWLVSYADFITLLFAFFVVMYAISQADMAKLKQVSDSMKKAFGASGSVGMIELEGNSGGNTANFFENPGSTGGRIVGLPAGKTHTAADPDPDLQSLKELLEESISLEMGVTTLQDTMKLEFDSRGLIVRLAVKDFFDPGKVDVHPDLRPLLGKVGKILAKTGRLLRVEGHADAGETNPQYASTWELSTARAAWVARYWMRKFRFDPKLVGVAGYAHYRPLTGGLSKSQKASNRRIEVVVLNNRYNKPGVER